MRTLHTEIEIDAPPPVVWRVLTDFAAYPSWNPFIVQIDGTPEVGATLAVTLQPPGRKPSAFRPTVEAAEAERCFAWRGQLFVPGLFDGAHRFELHPSAGGGTRLVHGERFTGLLVPVVWKMIGEATRQGFEAMNRVLKVRAEQAAREAAAAAGPRS